jgi:hypothetical protein
LDRGQWRPQFGRLGFCVRQDGQLVSH